MSTPPPPPPPRELVDDVIGDILLRLPPDEPKWLFRAALVCKPWLRTICDPAFLHRYRAFHGAPPLLGLVYREDPLLDRALRFVATTTTEVPALSVPIPVTDTFCPLADSFSASPLDCRHGRALLRISLRMDEYGPEYYYLVSDPVFRDPVRGNHRRVPHPDGIWWMDHDAAAAIFCAVTGCQHLDCHGGPFYVVLIFRGSLSADPMSATIYSSRKGAWSAPASLGGGIPAPQGIHNDTKKAYGRGTLIGDEIYFMLTVDAAIIKYDWVKNYLSVVNPPPFVSYSGGVTLMVMEDSSLGLAGIENSNLYLWSRRVSSEENAEWVQCRVIDLVKMVPMANPRDRAQVVGFTEGVGVIFITTFVGLFMVGLKSGRVKKIGKPIDNLSVLPYMSFYTPGGGRFLQLARSH